MESLFNKVASLKASNFIKRDSDTGLPVIIAILSFIQHLWWLLLSVARIFYASARLIHFWPNVPVLCRLKAPKNYRFSGVFREYNIGTLAWNGLIFISLLKIFLTTLFVRMRSIPMLSIFWSYKSNGPLSLNNWMGSVWNTAISFMLTSQSGNHYARLNSKVWFCFWDIFFEIEF